MMEEDIESMLSPLLAEQEENESLRSSDPDSAVYEISTEK